MSYKPAIGPDGLYPSPIQQVAQAFEQGELPPMTSPLDDAKLVERWRKLALMSARRRDDDDVDAALLEAADRLSSVLRENERLRARLKVWEPSVVSVTGGQTVSGCEARAALDPIKPDEKSLPPRA